MPKQDVMEAFGAATKRRMCLHPTRSACRGDIIRSHTIQRAVLAHIAVDAHVVEWERHPAAIFKSNGQMGARRVGLNAASTFTGFCAFHDDATFAPIEKQALAPTTEAAFLLGYRALCRELYAKEGQASLRPLFATLDRGRPVAEQVLMQRTMRDQSLGIDAGLRDLRRAKAMHDECLALGSGPNRTHAYWFVLDGDVPVACSGGLLPEVDFHGCTLQDLGDIVTPLDGMFFSILPTATGALVVFSWVDNAPSAAALVDSLLRLDQTVLPDALIQFAFEFFENVYMSPTWWDSLSRDDQGRLRTRAASGASLVVDRRPDWYRPAERLPGLMCRVVAVHDLR